MNINYEQGERHPYMGDVVKNVLMCFYTWLGHRRILLFSIKAIFIETEIHMYFFINCSFLYYDERHRINRGIKCLFRHRWGRSAAELFQSPSE